MARGQLAYYRALEQQAGTIQFVNDGKRQQIANADGFRVGKRLRLGMQPTRFLDGGTFTLGGRF